MSRQHAQQIIGRHRALVDEAARRLLGGPGQLCLYHMIRYHLGYVDAEGRPTAGSGGKGVRSALCLVACEAAGGEAPVAAPAAAALEFLHSFTLLHDDIADEDETRRGRPTVWRLWGVGQAMTAGDALHALASLSLARLDRERVAAETVAMAQMELSQASLAVCEGQHLDIAYEGRSDVSQDDYLAMVGLKTAALIRASTGIGALVAGAPEEATTSLRGFGFHLGLAYQIRDDILGLWGDPAEIGKPVGGDLRRNKRSLPITVALSSQNETLRSRLSEALARGVSSDDEAACLASLMEAEGVRAACERLAGEHLARALRFIGETDLREGPAHDLRTVAAYLVERTH